MTDNPFAALLAGVSHMIHFGKDGEGIKETKLYAEEHILAALAAAVPADLAEAGKVLESLAVFRTVWGELPSIAPHSETAPGITTGTVIGACGDATDLITFLLARIAAMEATIKGLEEAIDANWITHQRVVAAETALAAERAKVAKLVEALNTIDALDPEGRIGDCSVNAISGLVLRMGEIARAAITEASQ